MGWAGGSFSHSRGSWDCEPNSPRLPGVRFNTLDSLCTCSWKEEVRTPSPGVGKPQRPPSIGL